MRKKNFKPLDPCDPCCHGVKQRARSTEAEKFKVADWQEALREIKGAYQWEEIKDYPCSIELHMSRRGNGNGTDCEPDPAMIDWARDMRRSLREQWPGVRVTLDTIDEWVCVVARIDKEE